MANPFGCGDVDHGVSFSPSSKVQSGELSVKSVQGIATCSMDYSSWAPLKPGMVLGKGAELKTGPDATADLEFDSSGTVLRLRPDSLLELARMDEVVAGENVITDTRLNLKAGSIIGSQRKLAKPSTFTILTRNGSATIRGTEYLFVPPAPLPASGAKWPSIPPIRAARSARKFPPGFRLIRPPVRWLRPLRPIW